MSGFGNYSNNYNDMAGGYDDMQGGYNDMPVGFEEDEYSWEASEPLMNPGPMFRNPRRARYSDAYGDYRGGYGPGGGFSPRPMYQPGPMPPRPPAWGRGFGPGGPPFRKHYEDDRAVKYLMRCGVTKEHVRNLPRDLLRLIEPEHCGLCAQSFDSFSMSRIHYISKNHLKNQRKWLAQTPQGVNQNETPMKSRDLYCELCDVHITSKSHADAHYAGKSHRGIVEGRKNPKNPMLLQSWMEQRLEQLIRREKRCLKSVLEEKPEEEPVKDPKNVLPELYCAICKTSVTCSEQMTMHLNGKKHLTKEKQHILKMMKGELDEDKNKEDGENEGEAADPNGEENEEKEEDDWGNESWENQDQKHANAENANNEEVAAALADYA